VIKNTNYFEINNLRILAIKVFICT